MVQAATKQCAYDHTNYASEIPFPHNVTTSPMHMLQYIGICMMYNGIRAPFKNAGRLCHKAKGVRLAGGGGRLMR